MLENKSLNQTTNNYSPEDILNIENNFNLSVASLGDIYSKYLKNKKDIQYNTIEPDDLNNRLKNRAKSSKLITKSKNNSIEELNTKINQINLNFNSEKKNKSASKNSFKKKIKSKNDYDINEDPALKNRIIKINYLKNSKLPKPNKFSHINNGVINPLKSTFSLKKITETNIKNHENEMNKISILPNKVTINRIEPEKEINKIFNNTNDKNLQNSNSMLIIGKSYNTINEKNDNHVSFEKPKINKIKRKEISSADARKVLNTSERFFGSIDDYFISNNMKIPPKKEIKDIVIDAENLEKALLDFEKEFFSKKNNIKDKKKSKSKKKVKEKENQIYKNKEFNNTNFTKIYPNIDSEYQKKIEEKLSTLHIELRQIFDNIVQEKRKENKSDIERLSKNIERAKHITKLIKHLSNDIQRERQKLNDSMKKKKKEVQYKKIEINNKNHNKSFNFNTSQSLNIKTITKTNSNYFEKSLTNSKTPIKIKSNNFNQTNNFNPIIEDMTDINKTNNLVNSINNYTTNNNEKLNPMKSFSQTNLFTKNPYLNNTNITNSNKQYKNIPLNKTQSSFNQTKIPNYDISNTLNNTYNNNFNTIIQTQFPNQTNNNNSNTNNSILNNQILRTLPFPSENITSIPNKTNTINQNFLTQSQVINDPSMTINKIPILSNELKLKTNTQIQDERFNSFNVEFPIKYYYKLTKENEPPNKKDWYIRPHHIESISKNEKGIADDLLNTKYISYYGPSNIENNKRSKQEILEELISETHNHINELQNEMIDKCNKSKNGKKLFEKLENLKEEAKEKFIPGKILNEKNVEDESIIDYMLKKKINLNQSNLTIGVSNLILENLREKEKEILIQKRKEEYERIRPPMKNWFELKGDNFDMELKRNQMILKAGPEYYEKLNDLVSEDLY